MTKEAFLKEIEEKTFTTSVFGNEASVLECEHADPEDTTDIE